LNGNEIARAVVMPTPEAVAKTAEACRTMTVREVANALGVSDRVIQKHASEMGLTENGKKTELTERQATEIKNRIGKYDLARSCELNVAVTHTEMMQKAAEVMAWLTSENKRMSEKIALDAPKVSFHDAVTGSPDTIDIGNCAKILAIKGLGRNNLFEALRNKGVLMNNNEPYQKYVDAGYFRVIESTFTTPDGTTHINRKTVVFQKGLAYIRKVVTE
jgi:phage antirepressor YoqD-like protein